MSLVVPVQKPLGSVIEVHAVFRKSHYYFWGATKGIRNGLQCFRVLWTTPSNSTSDSHDWM